MTGTDAKRLNEGKIPMHLLPLWLLEDLAAHYGEGAKKYDPWNWTAGGSTDTCFGAMLRHATKWQAGEDMDEETSTHHMLAIAWNALTLYHGYKMGIDRDDRPDLPLLLRSVNCDDIQDGVVTTTAMLSDDVEASFTERK